MPGMQIGAVSRATGIAVETIRAWERRYGLLRPSRTPAGVRLYSEADVSRLRMVRQAIALGHPVSLAARLSESELSAAVAPRSATGAAAASTGATVVAEILEAADEYDLSRVQHILSSATLMMAPLDLIAGVLVPLMNGVGKRYEAGIFSIAQEHAVSLLVRNVIGSLSRLQTPVTGRAIIFVTPPDELHEFGILFAATLAALQGFEAFVLGTNVPALEVTRAARAIVPSNVVAGMTRDANPKRLGEYVSDLRRRLPASTTILLGGRGALRLQGSGLPENTTVIRTLNEFAARIGSPLRSH